MSFQSGKPVACLACRSMHVRCDARQPVCTRCVASNSECVYAASLRGQRGGRRKKVIPAATPTIGSVYSSSPKPPSTEASSQRLLTTLEESEGRLLTRLDRPSSDSCPHWIENSIRIFYNTIHRSHPFLTPYQEYVQDRNLLPLYLKKCMAFAACPYTSLNQNTVQQQALEVLDPSLPRDVFRVQALLLFVITSFPTCDRQSGMMALELAIDIATELGLGHESFASSATPIQQESYRRTWWQLYLITTMISLVSGTALTVHLDASRRLPCEEMLYEKGIPGQCGTFEEMQTQHVTETDISWSSFAYLVEGAYILAQVLNITRGMSAEHSRIEVEKLDASLTTFALSLPPEKQTPFRPNGEVDELLSMAHMFVSVAGICLHLPLSGIRVLGNFDTVCGNEHLSHPETQQAAQSYRSKRALKSAQSLIKILIGREDLNTITPCFACGLAFSTSTLLNALLAEDESGIDPSHVQELIRLSLTTLKRLGKTWQIASVLRFQLAKHYESVLRSQFNLQQNGPASLSAPQMIVSESSPGRNHLLEATGPELSLEDLLEIDLQPFVDPLPNYIPGT